MAKSKAQRRAEKQQKRAINMLNKLAKRGYINADDYIIEPADVSADKGTPITQGKSSKIRHKRSTLKPITQLPTYRQSKLSKRASNRIAKSNKNNYKMLGKLAKSVLDDGEITADEVIDIIDVDSEPIEQETEDFVPIQDQHITDELTDVSIIDEIRERIENLQRGEDVRPINIEQRKHSLLIIFDETIMNNADDLVPLALYLLDHKERIFQLLDIIEYDSGDENKVDTSFGEVGVLLNQGALNREQAEMLSREAEIMVSF